VEHGDEPNPERIGSNCMSSPTARSLEHLRKQGYTVDVVERWIGGGKFKVRKDLFGFGDLLAVRESEVVIVQTTSGDNVASRVKKIASDELAAAVAAVRRAGIRIVVHGWRKNASNRWQLREVDCS
jgi:hypothetical protein